MSAAINGVECLICGEIIVSTHRHDFRSCRCPGESRVCVDGGQEYRRRGWGKGSQWRDLATRLVYPEAWGGEQ